ncbi:MAG: hypothetical protein HFH13_12500 [Dorea sp.]|nr:hypothetical protein [Dorea sp.]
MSILTENYLVKNIRAYPVLRKKFMTYIKGVDKLPEGFGKGKLFHDYLKVRRNNPEKRVSQSEYMIFGFYNLDTEKQKKYLTDVEATRLMRPYNNESEPYLKSKATFLKNFTRFIHRGWLYVPEASYEEFCEFLHKYHTIALKPQYSSWGIGFHRLTVEEFEEKEHPEEYFEHLCAGKYLAEEFVESCEELAVFHPSSLNTLRVITFRCGERFEVFGGGLRVGNNGLHVDNAHGGGIFCEINPADGKIITDGLDEYSNCYVTHPMTGVKFRETQIPYWEEIIELCREASQELPCLRVVGWDVAILPDGRLELIEGNHNPGMNIVQAPAKHGVRDRFAAMLLDYYGDPEQYMSDKTEGQS